MRTNVPTLRSSSSLATSSLATYSRLSVCVAEVSSSRVRAGLSSVAGAAASRGWVERRASSASSAASTRGCGAPPALSSASRAPDSRGAAWAALGGRLRQVRVLEARRQSRVAGGQARHAPSTGAGGAARLGRVHTRCSTTELPAARSRPGSASSSACLSTVTMARWTAWRPAGCAAR